MISKNYLLYRIVEAEDEIDELKEKIEQMDIIISYLDDEIKKLKKPAKKTVRKESKK